MTMTKVHRLAAAVLPLLLAASIGCDDATRPGGDASNEGRFGASYEIVTNLMPAEPDEPPAIVNDSVSAMVSYAGGCEDHEFTLRSSAASDTARVWLRHDNGGDACEALITERITLPLPGSVLEASRVELLNPNADVPFILRWGSSGDPPTNEAGEE